MAATGSAQDKYGAICNYTNYNVGDDVSVRLQISEPATLRIRYAGQQAFVVSGVPMNGLTYVDVWKIPADARLGRYEVDLQRANGATVTNATSFAVHRKLAKVLSVELDKTFYTSGDAVNPTIVVRNTSQQGLEGLQVEFESYTYPWIAPAPDDPVAWKTIIAKDLSLGAGEQKTFYFEKAAVVQADKDPVAIYYSVVIRDTRTPDHIYDLAFAPPAFTSPPNSPLPKQYPFLYLYWHLSDLPKSASYRQFYPPEYVSDVIHFDVSHTMFTETVTPDFRYSVTASAGGVSLRTKVLDAAGREIESASVPDSVVGDHRTTVRPEAPGLYTFRVELTDGSGDVIAHNQLEFAVNKMPRSILIFCAHQDDDTAHPGLIRAATENHIPIHFVYLTSGDAGGCDRFYMHSCDAARAMDFGEVRMEEARASLGHLGVPRENVSFLGLPDGGMEQIWFDHLHDSDPYLSVLLASDHSPYREAAIPNLAYSRDSVVQATKDFITKYQPDLIVTGHPDERHVDHRTNNWVAVKAMQQLLREGKLSRGTQLLVDVVYGPQPGTRAPYHFEKEHFYVSGESAKLGQEATWYYQSQDGNHQQANIVDFKKLPREEPYPHYRILDWYDHEGWNEKRPVN
jgi:LmbE family N-acetylglucosaminyl deacetylase